MYKSAWWNYPIPPTVEHGSNTIVFPLHVTPGLYYRIVHILFTPPYLLSLWMPSASINTVVEEAPITKILPDSSLH